MTKKALELQGRTAELADGTEVKVWVEQGDGGISVAFIHDGAVIGRVTATRLAGRSAAELMAWTSRVWRGRGLAAMGMEHVLKWASHRRVPYLHGDLPGGDADQAALAFLHSCGLVTAIRTDAAGRTFASLVPASLADLDLLPSLAWDAATDRVIAAIEGGASEPEAAALYHQLTASIDRHPSAGRAAA
jgi:GNAT superfamily N-acetyltransferase